MLALYISLLDTEEQISKFEHIYTKYRGLMFYTAKGVLQDSYLAEDAVHETFLDIIRIIDSIRANNEKELSQFLRVMTHHKSVDMVRRCNRQRKSDAEIENFVLSKSDVNAETIVLILVSSMVRKAQQKSTVRLFFTKRINPEHIPKFPVVLPPVMGKKAHFLVQPTLNPAQHTS